MAEKKSSPKKDQKAMKREENGNIVLNIVVPSSEVEKAREKVVDQLISTVEVPGFRKGKAPRAKAEEQINKNTVKEEVLKTVLPDAYNKVVQENNINPIINPQIHIEVFDEGTDLKVQAVTAEAPEVKLGEYKKAVKEVTAKSQIIKPGEEEKTQKDNQEKIGEIIEAALSKVEINIPKVIIDQEVSRLMSQMFDELKQLGVSLEDYLKSRNLDGDKLKAEYQNKAEHDLKLEFMLRKIADEEKITVTENDISEAISGIQDEKQKEEVAKNPYLVANVIRQQKTLEYLSKL